MPIDAELDLTRTGEFPGDLVPETLPILGPGDRIIRVSGRGWHASVQVRVGASYNAPSSPPVPTSPERWEIGLIQQRIAFELTATWEDPDGNEEDFTWNDPHRRPDTPRGSTSIWAPPWPPPQGAHPTFVEFTYDNSDQGFGVEMTDGPSDPWLYHRNNVRDAWELRWLSQSYRFQLYLVARRVGTTNLHVIKVFDPFSYRYELDIPSSPYGGGGHPTLTSPPPINFIMRNGGGGAPVVSGPTVHESDDPPLIAAGLLLP